MSNQVPEGLTKCPVCGDYRGSCRAGDLHWEHPNGIDMNQILTASCHCNYIPCPKCKIKKVPRPGSNSYAPASNEIWHMPIFPCIPPCQKCHDARKQEIK